MLCKDHIMHRSQTVSKVGAPDQETSFGLQYIPKRGCCGHHKVKLDVIVTDHAAAANSGTKSDCTDRHTCMCRSMHITQRCTHKQRQMYKGEGSIPACALGDGKPEHAEGAGRPH